MPAFIVKLDREHDEYITWSTVVDAPTSEVLSKAKARQRLPLYYPRIADGLDAALDRAEEIGTSVNGRIGAHFEGAFDDDGFVVYNVSGVEGGSWLPRANLREFAHAHDAEDWERCAALVEPPEPIDDLPTGA